MAIRWKEGELDDLRKEIARYNRKIDRMRKQNVDVGMGSLPERGRIRDVKSMSSRAELTAFKKSMQRVLKPGSEELVKTKGGVVIPKYERAEINALNARINARRRKAYEKASEARAAGDLPLMGRIRANEAKPRKGLQKVTPKNYQEYKRVAFKEGSVKYPEIKKQMYRKNYYKMIDNLFSKKDARKIKYRIALIPLDDFVEKTIDIEQISFSQGSPPTNGRDSVIPQMVEKFKETFPKQFKTLKLDVDDDALMLEDEDYELSF